LKFKIIWFLFIIMLATASCGFENAPIFIGPMFGDEARDGDQKTVDLNPTFSSIQSNILIPKCLDCHSGPTAKQGVRLDSYEEIMNSPDLLIVPEFPDFSMLYMVISGAVGTTMPPDSPGLSEREIRVIRDWILNGAHED